jgi:glucose-1-phosphate cytidylyltransferase
VPGKTQRKDAGYESGHSGRRVGSRLAEETGSKPKPMVEIGGRPILWHIMMHYAYYGFNHFIIQYMVDYCLLNSDLAVNLRTGEVRMHGGYKPDWTVELTTRAFPS